MHGHAIGGRAAVEKHSAADLQQTVRSRGHACRANMLPSARFPVVEADAPHAIEKGSELFSVILLCVGLCNNTQIVMFHYSASGIRVREQGMMSAVAQLMSER